MLRQSAPWETVQLMRGMWCSLDLLPFPERFQPSRVLLPGCVWPTFPADLPVQTLNIQKVLQEFEWVWGFNHKADCIQPPTKLMEKVIDVLALLYSSFLQMRSAPSARLYLYEHKGSTWLTKWSHCFLGPNSLQPSFSTTERIKRCWWTICCHC